MKLDTKQRKKATKGFRQMTGEELVLDKLSQIMIQGKRAMDSLALEMGKMVVESIMLIEREELAGPDYYPTDPNLQKWAHEDSSVFVGDQKVKVKRPRLRDAVHGEVSLKSYQALRQPDQFSEELLDRVLRGTSTQKYEETVVDAASAFGVSPSSVSKKLVDVTAKKLKDFKERSLADFIPFAIFLDTIHRGGEAFLVALGVSEAGEKMALGFWEGSSENHVLAEELFHELERRELAISNRIIYITDGGKGIIKALKDRFGKKLMHQRCAIHKSRNLQKHLAKPYRKEAHSRLWCALEQNHYKDAKAMLLELEKWLRSKNESAADSLLEAFDELLTLHTLKVPALLRKTLITTNPIESMFSLVRHSERNIKRARNSKMLQRWLGTVLLYCENQFRTMKGFKEIAQVIQNIHAAQRDESELQKAA